MNEGLRGAQIEQKIIFVNSLVLSIPSVQPLFVLGHPVTPSLGPLPPLVQLLASGFSRSKFLCMHKNCERGSIGQLALVARKFCACTKILRDQFSLSVVVSRLFRGLSWSLLSLSPLFWSPGSCTAVVPRSLMPMCFFSKVI